MARDKVLSPAQNMYYALAYLVVGIIGTLGNGCIIYLFLRYKDLRKKEGLLTYVWCGVAASSSSTRMKAHQQHSHDRYFMTLLAGADLFGSIGSLEGFLYRFIDIFFPGTLSNQVRLVCIPIASGMPAGEERRFFINFL